MTRISAIVLGALLVFTLGCGGDKPEGEGGGMKMDKTEGDPFAALSAADQKLAKAQKTCVVSDEPLGSMGTPVKETVGDRTVFFCCESCRKPFLKNPEKYLAKLK
jgi:YHS domain-containing protein